jgi:hypothetical protein
MHDITTRYTELRYGGTNDEGGLRAFRDAVKAFKL